MQSADPLDGCMTLIFRFHRPALLDFSCPFLEFGVQSVPRARSRTRTGQRETYPASAAA